MEPCILIEFEFGSVGLLLREENRRNPKKNPRSKDENQKQTQPTYDAGLGNRTRATLVGGDCSHHCATPAHQCVVFLKHMVCVLFNTSEVSEWVSVQRSVAEKKTCDGFSRSIHNFLP